MQDGIKAQITPFSSVVGQSVLLTDETGAALAQISISIPDPNRPYRETAEEIARIIELAINQPPSEEVKRLRVRLGDLMVEDAKRMAAIANPSPAGGVREALEEAIEFAEQDIHALTPAGEAMVERWRAALSEVQWNPPRPDVEPPPRTVATPEPASSPATGEVVEALKPFALEAEEWGEKISDAAIVIIAGPACDEPAKALFTVGDLRRASRVFAALNPAPGHGEGGL